MSGAAPHPRGTEPAVCTGCRRRKPAAAFNANNKKTNGLQSRCRTCVRRAARHPDRQVRARAAKIKHKYGLSEAAFEELLLEQDGLCAICREVPDKQLYVDHCHTTGAVRGLLCQACNAGIGQLRDDPALVRNALRYLEGQP